MRVTERAQRAVHYDKQEAGRLGHDRVGTEHLLLGLLRDEHCLAVSTLGGLGIPPGTDLRYAVVYATPEPDGELPRPEVIGRCEVSDRAGAEYVSWTSTLPSFGMVRIHQRTFVPSPPAGTELLELRFSEPDIMPGEAPPLIVSTVDLL